MLTIGASERLEIVLRNAFGPGPWILNQKEHMETLFLMHYGERYATCRNTMLEICKHLKDGHDVQVLKPGQETPDESISR